MNLIIIAKRNINPLWLSWGESRRRHLAYKILLISLPEYKRTTYDEYENALCYKQCLLTPNDRVRILAWRKEKR